MPRGSRVHKALTSLFRTLWALVVVLGLSWPAAQAQAQPQSRAKKQTASAVKVERKVGGKAAKPTAVQGRGLKVQGAPRAAARQAKPNPRMVRVLRNGKRVWVAAQPPAPPRPSVGKLAGLHEVDDPLDLKSSVALVVDEETQEVLFSKNSEAVLPIASITKLMTALIVAESGLPMDEMLVVQAIEALEPARSSRSRLAPGTQLSRGELMHLALMASENRAAHALGRHYPGGLPAFVQAMNAKARLLGMHDTRFVEPTGLSAANRSSAQDLAMLVRTTSHYPQLREWSTSHEMDVAVGRKQVQFRNTNGLVHNPLWQIGLQKTGFITDAGRCVVMQAQVAGRKLIMVLLDSAGRYARMGDAERLRTWLAEAHQGQRRPGSASPEAAFVPAALALPQLPAALALPQLPTPQAVQVLPLR
jgi:serine-type D-Ala-D-Ala endopeptidase (penicillin-binding protein 7)